MKTRKREAKESYPIFAFRISDEEKEKLNSEISRVKNLLETAREKREGDSTHKYRRNDVILEALMLGLKQLKKRGETK